MLFKIDMIVDGRKLEAIYSAVEGLAYNVSAPILIKGAEVKGNKVKEANGSEAKGVDFVDKIYKQLKSSATPNDIKVADLKAALKSAGYSPDSYSYLVNRLSERKMVRRLATKGHYKLLEV
jgi:hypothetical protein